MTIEREISSNAPALVVRTQGSDRSLEAGPSYTIGRNPESDIVVNEARVSWRHAVLRLEGATWLLEDAGSTNGTFLGAQRVQRVEITKDCVLRLGHPEDGQRLWCSPAPPPPQATAIASHPAGLDDPPAVVPPPASAAPPAPDPWGGQPVSPPVSPPVGSPVPPAGAWDSARPPAAPPADSRGSARPAAPPADLWGPARPVAPPPVPPSGSRDSARSAPPVYPEQPSIVGSSIVRRPSAIMRLPTRVLRIGRATDND